MLDGEDGGTAESTSETTSETAWETTSEGGSHGQISIDQAGVMAIRTALASGGRRHWMFPRSMVFDVFDAKEDEGGYTIVLSFRPDGVFDGTPGQEQFKFSKTGAFRGREFLSSPKSSMQFLVKNLAKITVALAVCGVIGAVLAYLVFSDTLDPARRWDASVSSREDLPRGPLTILATEITKVVPFGRDYTLTVQAEVFGLPRSNVQVRKTTSDGTITESTTQFIRQSTGRIYVANVQIGAEDIENPSLDWVRDNITVEILLEQNAP